jgi:hypothetical protein
VTPDVGAQEQPHTSEVAQDGEVLPVLAARPPRPAMRRAREIARGRVSSSSLPTVQAAAVAAGSFVAGAAFAGLVHRRSRSPILASGARAGRALARPRKGASPAAEGLQIVSSRTLLVDVHLLGLPDSGG